MPVGIAHQWTLLELQLVDDLNNDARELAASIGVSRNAIYSMRARLRIVGSPEVVYQEVKSPIPRNAPQVATDCG